MDEKNGLKLKIAFIILSESGRAWLVKRRWDPMSGSMFICICNAVTDSEVRTAIARGASSREEVTDACRAGGDCGACHHMIEAMVEEHEELISANALVRESRVPQGPPSVRPRIEKDAHRPEASEPRAA